MDKHLKVDIAMKDGFIDRIDIDNLPALKNHLERRRVLDLCFKLANELVRKPKSNPRLYELWSREKAALTRLYQLAEQVR